MLFKMLKIIKKILGVLMLVVAVLGLILPVIPGVILIFPGLKLLGFNYTEALKDNKLFNLILDSIKIYLPRKQTK
ncbi:MAG: hypothetical protein PHS07_00940 [Patescibacteria group bacterium]|nr:hypothetical protein [Patescibacteria group bacterium]